MARILDALREAVDGSDVSILASERVNLDVERFGEYRDSAEHPAAGLFESDPPPSNRQRVADLRPEIQPILTYFLDGSRRTYKVADVVMKGRYLPLVAGQVGVAVLKRDKRTLKMRPVHEYCAFENFIAFPDTIPADDLKSLQERIAAVGRSGFRLVRYSVKPDADPVDLGVAKIMDEMARREVEAVLKMASDGALTNSDMLVIDGPLRFKRSFDVVQFRNVIGLSKSFRPSFSQGAGRKKRSVGEIAVGLRFGERSPVFETSEGPNKIGMWYLRMRRDGRLANPIQGVVKLETFAVDVQEREQGLDSDRISTLSAHLLRERNVTPFQADKRWAAHIYPIYMAETYAKKRFMSDVAFKSLF